MQVTSCRDQQTVSGFFLSAVTSLADNRGGQNCVCWFYRSSLHGQVQLLLSHLDLCCCFTFHFSVSPVIFIPGLKHHHSYSDADFMP